MTDREDFGCVGLRVQSSLAESDSTNSQGFDLRFQQRQSGHWHFDQVKITKYTESNKFPFSVLKTFWVIVIIFKIIGAYIFFSMHKRQQC